jgi:hypothetical protein
VAGCPEFQIKSDRVALPLKKQSSRSGIADTHGGLNDCYVRGSQINAVLVNVSQNRNRSDGLPLGRRTESQQHERRQQTRLENCTLHDSFPVNELKDDYIRRKFWTVVSI